MYTINQKTIIALSLLSYPMFHVYGYFFFFKLPQNLFLSLEIPPFLSLLYTLHIYTHFRNNLKLEAAYERMKTRPLNDQ